MNFYSAFEAFPDGKTIVMLTFNLSTAVRSLHLLELVNSNLVVFAGICCNGSSAFIPISSLISD